MCLICNIRALIFTSIVVAPVSLSRLPLDSANTSDNRLAKCGSQVQNTLHVVKSNQKDLLDLLTINSFENSIGFESLKLA